MPRTTPPQEEQEVIRLSKIVEQKPLSANEIARRIKAMFKSHIHVSTVIKIINKNK